MFTIAMSVSCCAQAEWSLLEKTDDFTDESLSYAVFDDGTHRVQII